MTQTKKPIYTLVRMRVPCIEKFDLQVYSKRTSNLEKMKEYKNQIQTKYPNDRVLLVTKERAEEIRKGFEKYRRDAERKLLEQLDKDLNEIEIRVSYYKSIERR